MKQNKKNSTKSNQYNFIKHKYDCYGVDQNSSSFKRINLFYTNKQKISKKQYVYNFGETFEINAMKIKDLFGISQNQEINLFENKSQHMLNSNIIQTQINKRNSKDYQIKIKLQQKQQYDTTASTSQENKQNYIIVNLYKDKNDTILFSKQKVFDRKQKLQQFVKKLEKKYGIIGIRLSYYKQKNTGQVQQKSFQELVKKSQYQTSLGISYDIQKPCLHCTSNVTVYRQQQKDFKPIRCLQVRKGQLLKSFPFNQDKNLIEVKDIIYSKKQFGKNNQQSESLNVSQVMKIECQPSKDYQNNVIQCHPKAQLVCRFSEQNPEHCLKLFGNVFNPDYDLKTNDYLVRCKNGKQTYHKIINIQIINKRSESNKHFMSLKFQNQSQVLLMDGFGIKLTSNIIYFSDSTNKLTAQLQNCSGWKVSKVKQELIKLFKQQAINVKKISLWYKNSKEPLKQHLTLADYYLIKDSKVLIKIEQGVTMLKKPQINKEKIKQQKYPCWFGGQSRIYLQDDEQYQSTLQQMFNNNHSSKQMGYDHKSDNMHNFSIKGVQKKTFPQYIKIQFEQEEKQIICHPNAHFKCAQNKIKSFQSLDQNKKLNEKDQIKIYEQTFHKIKTISLIKKQIELFKVNVYNEDLKRQALISVNQTQIINQAWYLDQQKYEDTFKFCVTWKGATYQFDYYQNRHFTFAQCFSLSMPNLPERFIVFSQKIVLKSKDKVQNVTRFLKSNTYQDFTISMSQNIMLFSKQSQQILSNDQIQAIQNANQKNSQIPQQYLNQCYKKAKNLQNFRAIMNNKVFLVYQDLKFSNFYNSKQVFFWKQFQFASTQWFDQDVCKEIASPNCTIFQIQTYTAKKINSKSDLVMILPYVYYYVWSIQTKSIKQGTKVMEYQLVKIHQLKCPSFQKNIILWADDIPEQNQKYIDKIKQNDKNIEVIQLRSTGATIAWIKEFKNILITYYKDLQLKIISDMVRNEQVILNQKPNYFAGIQLLKQFYKQKHFTGNILIFCGDESRAEQNIKKQGITKQHSYQVTDQQQELLKYSKFQKAEENDAYQEISTTLSESDINISLLETSKSFIILNQPQF